MVESLHLTTAHTPTDTRIFDKEATSLVNAGFDVGILAHNSPSDNRNDVTFFDLGSPLTRTDRWQSLPKVARKAKGLDASVYHFHDPELIPVGVYLSVMTDSAVIYDVHENFEHKVAGRDWIPDVLSTLLSYTIPQAEKAAARHFDAVVSATEQIGQKFNQVCSEVHTIHNFPRVDGLPTIDNAKSRDSDYVLCYVGGLSELRGLYRMLELVNLLRQCDYDIELWALGSWSSETEKERAEQYIAKKGLKDRIHFPGYLSYEVMFQYLYAADVGLTLLDTRQFERAIPTKQFEYLYAGLPVITTPLDAAIKYIPDRYRYVVQQGDTQATADAVERALKIEYERSEMQSLIEQKYCWEKEAISLISLYERLIA